MSAQAWSADSIPLDDMSLSDKLSLIETVWDSLSQKGEDFESPEWHGEVLQKRMDMEKVQRGDTEFRSLESVRQRLNRPIVASEICLL